MKMPEVISSRMVAVSYTHLDVYKRQENHGSRKVMEKCGFHRTDILHFDDFPSGLYVYSLQIGSGDEKQEQAAAETP